MGDSTTGEMAGSAVVDVSGLSQEHLPPELTSTVSTGTLPSTCGFDFGAGCGVSAGASGSLEQHDLRLAVATGFGSGAASGFEQQQPFVTFSMTGHAHATGAH